MYPYDPEITAEAAAELLDRSYATVRKWVSRYNVPRLGRNRKGETLLDYRVLAAVHKAISHGEPVPTDWAAFALSLVA
jgi:phage terminase Nu1 subunit (DNA packaging protein)